MIITGGTIITPEKEIKNGCVIISGDKIAAVQPGSEPVNSERDTIINAKGKTVMPGFIDLHIQGCCERDVWEEDVEAINQMATAMTSFGTTAFLGTTHYLPATVRAIREACEHGTPGAQILGLHLEGPFINKEKAGAISGDCFFAPSDEKLREIFNVAGDCLKQMTVAPELDGSTRIIERITENGVVASVGHSNATFAQTRMGIDAGIRHATHLFNAMRGIESREPGVVGAVLTDNRVSAEIIADGVHVHPGTINLATRAKGADKIALITDAMSAAGLSCDAIARYGDLQLTVDTEEGSVRLPDGTLAGSIITMNKAVKNVVSLVGMTLQQAARMAAETPATVLGLEDRKGRIAPGMDADITILDDQFDVCTTIVGGQIVWQR